MKLVHLVRSVPEHDGGPLECDAPESAVQNYKKRGWRESEVKENKKPVEKQEPAEKQEAVIEPEAEKAEDKPSEKKEQPKKSDSKKSDKNLF